MEFEQIAEAIELPDNSGRKRLALSPKGFSAGSYVADVTIAMESVEGESASELTLTACSISRDKLVHLDELLTQWLAERSPFEVNLAQDHWARLAFTVGPDPDWISSEEKPAVKIEVEWCGIDAVAVLVVDQSCMRLFHEGVSGWLRLSRAAAG